jgi:uncharacterized protein (TIGR02246 family)
MRQFVWTLVVMLVCSASGLAEAETKEEIAQAAREWVQAWTAGTIDGISAMYADDAQYYSSLSLFRIDGRPAIRNVWAGIFAAFPTRQLALRHESVQAFGDSTGVWNAYWQAVVTDRAGKVTTVLGRFSTTWVKLGGRWVIVHQHFSSLPATT